MDVSQARKLTQNTIKTSADSFSGTDDAKRIDKIIEEVAKKGSTRADISMSGSRLHINAMISFYKDKGFNVTEGLNFGGTLENCNATVHICW